MVSQRTKKVNDGVKKLKKKDIFPTACSRCSMWDVVYKYGAKTSQERKPTEPLNIHGS